jgi:hypothetical protein
LQNKIRKIQKEKCNKKKEERNLEGSEIWLGLVLGSKRAEEEKDRTLESLSIIRGKDHHFHPDLLKI